MTGDPTLVRPRDPHGIAADLRALLSTEQVVTDAEELRAASIDRFRKYEAVRGVSSRPLPAAIAYVNSTEEAAAVIGYATEHGVPIVPRTGRSATEGGLETLLPNSIVLDGSRMEAILDIDERAMQVSAQCGVRLERLEDELRARGLTTGHSPQSLPLACLGGLVATRSIGQLSTLYGGIEDMVAGLEAVFPGGQVARIKAVPRRAAGPDIRHLAIGNEGALCFVTEMTLKLHRYAPEYRHHLGFTIASMEAGFDVLREVMVQGYRPSVARLYDPADAAQHFANSPTECVLIFVTEGNAEIAEVTARGIQRIAIAAGAAPMDTGPIEQWFAQLNWGPDKIAAELAEIARTDEIGFTTEVSGDWRAIGPIYHSVCNRLRRELPDLLLVGGHASHCYSNGTNLYFVYAYRVDCAPEDEARTRHDPINKIICEETLRHGGSIAHHHGIGKARTPWVAQEYGSSYPLLTRLKSAFDPTGVMNPGTVVPIEDSSPVCHPPARP